ncbi:MAG: ATP-binding cassette domain-containing protein, partial [Actinophytocola sp.]|nr:ATP-binding cassette domain-containing protein [Actinophytocola sp.]
MSSAGPLLEVRDLRVRYGREVDALRGVSLCLAEGESCAVVGESGSGKTTLALCLAGLVQPPEATGSVRLAGHELIGATTETLRTVRWRTVALALQGAPFNPVTTVGAQLAEPLREHLGLGDGQARARAEELTDELALDRSALDRFPHQLSGGQRRRAMLAMALACDPRLVILDEPTQGLDLATASALGDRIAEITRERGLALLVISHDLPQATRLADRTVVLYAGEAMEAGATSRITATPAHPYTWALLGAYPVMTTSKDLRPIRGS